MVKYKIAIDLGGTHLRVAVLKNNKIIKFVKNNTPLEKNYLLRLMEKNISEFIKEYGKSNIKGIGISSAGMISKGVIKISPNLPLKNFNLKKIIQKKFKLKVEVENDANCFALAELKLGLGKGKKNFVLITLGTGIGGGIILNGQLYKGFDGEGYASELGHFILNNGKDFENFAGGKAVKKLSKKYCKKVCMVSELTKNNDKNSKKILDEITSYLGQGIASLINILDPEVIILAGGFKEAGDKLLKMIKEQTKKYTIIPRKTTIVWTKLEHEGILGASLLID